MGRPGEKNTREEEDGQTLRVGRRSVFTREPLVVRRIRRITPFLIAADYPIRRG